MSPESERLMRQALAAERRATANRMWSRIEKVAPAPDRLTDTVSIQWIDLMAIFDKERAGE